MSPSTRLLGVLLGAALVTLAGALPEPVSGQTDARRSRGERFRSRTPFIRESAPGNGSVVTATDALVGFDNLTNGFDPQGPDFDSLNEDNVVAGRSFNDNRFIFEEFEVVADGLGPTYNAQSCRECHQNVATGGASQVAEHRTGRLEVGQFVESLGGSLIQSRAIHPSIVERVPLQDEVRTFRISTNTLGDGYVEAIANETLIALRDAQPAALRGTAIMVPVLEGNGGARLGRFGWKNQHASLESFAADAYLNEMGITSPLLPEENSSAGEYVGAGSGYDDVPDPEDDGADLVAFADFMRATKAPARGPITADAVAGEQVFRSVGCATCHTPAITTAPVGSVINAGALTVPAALASRIIRPYSDFLLHDIGTGDGIPILPDAPYAGTARQMRTAPLWGLRTRNRLMHDGLSFTKPDAIRRHRGQAASVTARFDALSRGEQVALIRFLDSL